MVTKNISHTVTRAGRTLEHEAISIPVASDLSPLQELLKKKTMFPFIQEITH